ncbi:unnamed protein product [Mytilus coruscus]|uniref:HMG domain-containing protein n=1 Tax=Mytilus coruscus TaxID=42192 RepID=A0A6J8DGY1_MYTCO|nr:unnamed protein product [Mytilus coruscus]
MNRGDEVVLGIRKSRLKSENIISTVTVFGATSSRPELQCPAAATVQQFDDREWKSNLFKNLSQCTDVIHQEEHCSSALKEAGFASPETPFLLQLEKSLLDIALPALSDGTFYCSLFKIENNCYCRFFESGVLEGYILAEGIRYVKSYMEENFDNISMGKFIWCQVSTPEDITQYHQRYAKRLDRKRSHKAISQPSADIGRRFNYLMTKNKGSVVNAHRNLLAKAQTLSPTSENLQFLGTVLHVIKKNSHKETNQLLARYHDATGAFRSASHTWEISFQQYRVNGVPQHPPEFSSLLDTPRSSHFTWHEKCMIISAIPNNHYWDEVDQAHVGYARMLSVRDEVGKKKPASLRNLILLHSRDKDFGTIYQLVKRYKNPATETSAIQSTVNQTSNYTDVSQPEEQRSVRTRRKALTEEDILRNLTILNPDFIEENRSTENSLYQQYKTAQIESGTLQWRLHKPHIDILCMNDINMNTGTIYDFSYVHMTRTLEGNELHYNCTYDDDAELNEPVQTDRISQDGVFKENTGLWDFPSLSQHPPKQDNDPSFREAIQLRHAIFDGAKDIHRDSTGCLTGQTLVLCPPLPLDNCPCGTGYYSEMFPEGKLSEVRYRPTVYLTNGPARYVVRDRECLAGCPGCLVKYSGDINSLHFLSKETAAGDEIGWDFIDHALNTHVTFSAFCKIMSNKYSRIYSSAKFMSVQTFISWWFSWSSKFKIDFRKQCYICKSNPKFLACDGTKIGISFRQSNVKPIETPEPTAELIDPCHRRNDRAFLRFRADLPNENDNIRNCRDHLAYLARKQLGLTGANDILSFQTETDRTENLINTVDEKCKDIIRRFYCNEYPDVLMKKLSIIFKGLSSNHSLSAFIPFKYTELFMSILNEIENGDCIRLNLVSEFSPEIRDVLNAAQSNRNNLTDVISFFQYLTSRVDEIKQLNKPAAPANPQHGSYNPTKNGVAYYFTPSGEKQRDLSKYTMNDKAHSKNYDDLPARANEQCNKIYPEVSRKGTTYLFLWFDPKHYGHCYGFHIIPGSEGRKDPFSSAYCYLKEAPEEVFYDFSCQFEEYCLNREPGFWENTRFWHDLFHGYSHKCPYCYKSQRLAPLQGLNTEICEQFNSFIQKIKYSARSMTLEKFCFYLQFMIYHWCERKREAFEKRCGIAAAYLA